jgi:hypothetical protein
MKLPLRLGVLLLALRASSQITTTATQAALNYSTTTTSQCQIEVSTSNMYSPLVHAVDPTLFANANMDGQTNAGARQFVVGQRWVGQENASPPSIMVGATSASLAVLSVRASPVNLKYGNITVTYTGQPFSAGDNIVVTGMGNSSFNTARGRVMTASTNSFTYFVPNSTAGTSGGGTITRANKYSLALENTTTYYYRIGAASNACGASPATGTFTTMNWPNGDTWAENAPLDANGVPTYPTFPESQAANVGINDPMTGTLTKPLGLFSDDESVTWNPGGSGNHCSWQADSNGFYHCYEEEGNGGGSMLYAVNETTGEVRYLGAASFRSNISPCSTTLLTPQANPNQGGAWDDSNPNELYGICKESNGHADVYQAKYTGNDVAVVESPPGNRKTAAVSLTILTPSSVESLDELVTAFDPSFNYTQYNAVAANYEIGGYLNAIFARYQQGSPSWLVVFNLGDKLPIDSTCGSTRTNCPRVIAGKARWGPGLAATCGMTGPLYCTHLYPFRWSGSHGSGQTNFDEYGWTQDSGSYLTGGGAMGPFQIALNQSSGLNATDATDTITVTSTPPAACNTYGAGVIGDPMSAQCPPDGSPFLDQALPGDLGEFEDFDSGTYGEIIQVLARNSATSLTVARGCHLNNSSLPYTVVCDGTGEVSHANEENFYMVERGFIGTGGSDIGVPGCCNHSNWNFVNDPHAHDQTGIYLVDSQGYLPSHYGAAYPYEVDEGYNMKDAVPLSASYFQSIQDYSVLNVNAFNGILPVCGGSSCNMYPKYLPMSTSTQPRFWDSSAYTGSANPVATVVSSGTGYVIEKFNFATGNTFSPTLPYFSMSGIQPLVDISGPGSSLPASSSGNYQFCIVHAANECVSGSAVTTPPQGYGNFPAATIACSAGEAGAPTKADWCLENMFSGGHGIEQVGITAANQIGASQGKPIYGWGNSRKIVSPAMFMWPRWTYSTGNNMVPDDSWVTKDDCKADPYVQAELQAAYPNSTNTGYCLSEVYMYKIPPQPPADSTVRTTYTTAIITVGAGSGGATHARIKYGFEENEPTRGTTWPPTIHFYATQYQGLSYYSDQNLSLSTQYNLGIGVPQRVLFYQIEYLNSGNSVVATDPLTAITTDPVVPPNLPSVPENLTDDWRLREHR